MRLGVGERAGVAAGLEPEALRRGRVGGQAEDVVDAVRDHGDALAGRDAVGGELVAGEAGDGEDAQGAAAEDREAEAVPEAEGAGVGARGDVDLRVVDQGDAAPRRERAEVAEVHDQAVAGVERQLDLLPGDPAQEPDFAPVDALERERAGALRAEKLDLRVIAFGEQGVDGADQLLGRPVDAGRAGGEELAVEDEAPGDERCPEGRVVVGHSHRLGSRRPVPEDRDPPGPSVGRSAPGRGGIARVAGGSLSHPHHRLVTGAYTSRAARGRGAAEAEVAQHRHAPSRWPRGCGRCSSYECPLYPNASILQSLDNQSGRTDGGDPDSAVLGAGSLGDRGAEPSARLRLLRGAAVPELRGAAAGDDRRARA